MAELVATAEEIIKIGIYVHETIQDVKAFKSYAENLLDQIDHLIPSVQVLADMTTQVVGELSAALKQESQLLNIAQSLSNMLQHMEEVKVFMQDLKGINVIQKITERERVKRNYEQLSEKLNVLRVSISFTILTETLNEIESGRCPDPVVKISVRHAQKFEAVNTSGKDMIPWTRTFIHVFIVVQGYF